MKQIGTSITMYAQDYDESVVPSQNGTTGVNLVSWPSLIQPYIKNSGVFVCPSASDTMAPPDPTQIKPTTRQYLGVTVGNANTGADGSDPQFTLVPRLSYTRNLIPTKNGNPWDAMIANRVTNNGKTYPGFVDYANNLKSGWVGTGTTFTLTLADIADPSGTIHIVDGSVGVVKNGDPTSYGGSMRGLQQDIRTDLFNDDPPSKVQGRHSGGFVILYGDGHSGWKKWGSTNPCMWTVQDDKCN